MISTWYAITGGAGSPDGLDDGDVNLDDSVNSDDLDAVRANWGATLGTPFSGSRSSGSSQTAWTSEADDVFRKYGLLDADSSNDLAIDADFWDDLYKALGLPVL